MASKLRLIDGGRGSSGGDGPEDPMLIERVDGLEKRMERVEARLSSIEVLLAKIDGQLSQMPKASDLTAVRGEIGALRADVARIDGRISGLPNFWQVATMVIGTGLALWLRGAVR